MSLENLKRYSPALLRTGIAIVFLWFGFSQLKNAAMWTRMMPEYIQSVLPFSTMTLIHLNGAFEIIFATLLLLGLYTRLSSLLLGLHLLHIVTIVGYGAVGMRDFALALAAFSIFLRGPDEFCLDTVLTGKKQNINETKKEEITIRKPESKHDEHKEKSQIKQIPASS